MTMESPIANIIHQPVSQRLSAIEDIWDSICLEPESVQMPQWHRHELRRRQKAYESKPKEGLLWPDVRQKIEGKDQSKI